MTTRFQGLLTAIMIFLSCVIPATAQQRYTPLPPVLDGSMMPYDFSACTQVPYLPDSLKPIYSAYVARHGARFLSGPKKMKKILDALEKGRNAGSLSQTGEDLLKLMYLIKSANEDNWGDLSPTGIAEERKLARRMAGTLPLLAVPGVRMAAISSYVPRAVMTMYQFSNQLTRLNDKMSVRTDEGPQFDSLLCCFIYDKEFAEYRRDGDWKPVYDEFVKRVVSPDPARRLFSSTALSDHDLRNLTLEMYEVLKGNRAAGLPAPTTQWMSVAEYQACYRASNLQHYLRNSVTPLSSVAARATSPLLRRVIADTDSALAVATATAKVFNGLLPVGMSQNSLLIGEPIPTVNGYFGHAETLLPLLSLIKIPGCFDLPLDYDHLDSCWKIQNITPLGANLLILISRAPSGKYYAAVQLNGRTVKPIKGQPDIVLWDTLRDYWMSLMAEYARD